MAAGKFIFAIPVLLGLCGGMAHAECPPGYPEGLPCPISPAESVPLEHGDRVERLKRLSQGQAGFEFHTTMIDQAEHGMADYPIEIPVLRVVADHDLFFDSASDDIRNEAEPILDIMAESLRREPPDVSLFVAGHTDSHGDEGYNQELGLRRAQAVAAALVRRGIYQATVYRVSFGEAVPIASNQTAAGRARNRRVEFLFGAQPKAVVNFLERQKISLCVERIDDRMNDDCRIPISFGAQKLQIDPSHVSQVQKLEAEARELELNPPSDPIKLEERRQMLRLERERIPVVISTERIAITITPDLGTAVENSVR